MSRPSPPETPESLRRFYAEIAPLLFGEVDVGAVERTLGPSPSGPDNLDFYRVLLARNVERILRDLFPTVHALVTRDHPGLWPTLVHAYARAHPSNARDPNRFGLAFSDFLAERRIAGEPPLSPVLEELADLHMCRYLAAVSPDPRDASTDDPDGFEPRVFLRGYSFPVPAFPRALAGASDTPIPEPRPTTIIVYRSVHEPRPVRTLAPTLEQLGALARRQGLVLTGPLARLQPDTLDQAELELVALGVLRGC